MAEFQRRLNNGVGHAREHNLNNAYKILGSSFLALVNLAVLYRGQIKIEHSRSLNEQSFVETGIVSLNFASGTGLRRFLVTNTKS